MSIGRRDFIRTGVAGSAALVAAGVSGACRTPPQPQTRGGTGGTRLSSTARSLTINFTGLIVGEFGKTTKTLQIALVDAAKAGVMEPHASLLIVDLADYVFPESFGTPGNGPDVRLPLMKYQPPQIVRLGSQTLGMWGLAGCKLWLRDNQTTFDASDANASLEFPELTGTNVTRQPETTEAAWAGLQWLAKVNDLAAATGDDPSSIAIDPTVIAAQISITRGSGSAIMPYTACERSRRYRFEGQRDSDNRYYASEFKIDVQPAGDTTDIAIFAPAMLQGTAGVIRVKTPQGKAAAVSIANSPIGRSAETHFTAYSRVYKLRKSQDLEAIEGACNPALTPAAGAAGGANAQAAQPANAAAQGAPNPPDKGCLVIVRVRA